MILFYKKKFRVLIYSYQSIQEFLKNIKVWQSCYWSKVWLRWIRPKDSSSGARNRPRSLNTFFALASIINMILFYKKKFRVLIYSYQNIQEFLKNIKVWQSCYWSKVWLRWIRPKDSSSGARNRPRSLNTFFALALIIDIILFYKKKFRILIYSYQNIQEFWKNIKVW